MADTGLHRRILQNIILHDQAFPHVRPDDLREELKDPPGMATPSLTESMSPTPLESGHRSSTPTVNSPVPLESSPRRSGSILRRFLTPRKISYSSTHHPSPPISDMRSMMCSSKRNQSLGYAFSDAYPVFALCSHARLVTSICPVPISPQCSCL